MLSFTPLLDNTINKPIYYQLYEYIKKESKGFMKEGHWQNHVQKIRKCYPNKYNAITKAVQTHMKDNVNLISSGAGLRVIL